MSSSLIVKEEPGMSNTARVEDGDGTFLGLVPLLPLPNPKIGDRVWVEDRSVWITIRCSDRYAMVNLVTGVRSAMFTYYEEIEDTRSIQKVCRTPDFVVPIWANVFNPDYFTEAVFDDGNLVIRTASVEMGSKKVYNPKPGPSIGMVVENGYNEAYLLSNCGFVGGTLLYRFINIRSGNRLKDSREVTWDIFEAAGGSSKITKIWENSTAFFDPESDPIWERMV